MEYEVYYDPDEVLDAPANETLRREGTERVLRRLRDAGVEYRAVDVSEMSGDQLREAYDRLATPPSVWKRYRVRELFGTQKYPGAFFGKGVPALVVLENGRPVDVYPHVEGGKIVSITDFIERMAGGNATGAELAARMDALRAEIGRVDRTASEFVEGGRRR